MLIEIFLFLESYYFIFTKADLVPIISVKLWILLVLYAKIFSYFFNLQEFLLFLLVILNGLLIYCEIRFDLFQNHLKIEQVIQSPVTDTHDNSVDNS